MFDLGKLEAQIIVDLGREQAVAQEFVDEMPPAQEDHLDWLQPDRASREAAEKSQVIERSEDHRDWSESGEDRLHPAPAHDDQRKQDRHRT